MEEIKDTQTINGTFKISVENGKFKIGNIITTKIPRQGIENTTIIRKDKNNYYCSILRGIAIIPKVSENLYRKIQSQKNK